MSQCQRHAQDATLVDNDDPADFANPKKLPSYIPKPQPGRTLVLCFDGTGDQFDEDNSNIIRLVKLLKKDDNTKQLVYYQAGIGTYTSPVFITPFMADLSQAIDTVVAWNIHAHVIGGYEFLVQNYRPGDKICIFGFSRGAYIARSLAAMIHKVGIIPVDNQQQIPFAYKMYTRPDDKNSWKQANDFKLTFSVDVDIEFVGVWDTVDSVGIIPKYFPLTASDTSIKTFRHAVSLDEHRSKFNVNLWNRPADKENDPGVDTCEERIRSLKKLQIIGDEPTSTDCTPNGDTVEYKLRTQYDGAQDRVEMLLSNTNNKATNVEEVWFAGCHCDVGGGSVVNGTRHSLARIPLRWMVRECFKAKTGILFDTAFLYTIGLDPTTLYPNVLDRPPLSDSLIAQARKQVIQTPESTRTSRSQWLRSLFMNNVDEEIPEKVPQTVPFDSEDTEDLRDALSPEYDQMKINRLWWILEMLPVKRRYQDLDQNGNFKSWVSRTRFNRGRGRIIPNKDILRVKVHRSVKLRMEAQPEVNHGRKYQPKADFTLDLATWI